jgi:hypothetical protein
VVCWLRENHGEKVSQGPCHIVALPSPAWSGLGATSPSSLSHNRFQLHDNSPNRMSSKTNSDVDLLLEQPFARVRISE